MHASKDLHRGRQMFLLFSFYILFLSASFPVRYVFIRLFPARVLLYPHLRQKQHDSPHILFIIILSCYGDSSL